MPLTPVRPDFVPDASLSRSEMESLQRDVRRAAVFDDDLPFAVSYDRDLEAALGADERPRGESPESSETAGPSTAASAPGRAIGPDPGPASGADRSIPPGGPDLGDAVVAGVDQAFLDDRVVSAIVCLRGGTGAVLARASAVTPLEIPYVPGLLAFREGGPILAAFANLDVDPDLVVFDGSGRIHYRQAGIATHVGVTLDLPSIGVAKNLLCGRLDADPEGRPAGWYAPVYADAQVEVHGPAAADRDGGGSADTGSAAADTVIGHAYQSRQYDGRPVINPLYVSPGHRLSTTTTVAAVAACCDGYKLPEPTRRADAYADELKQDLS